jgi:hypothetical protein
VEGYGLLTGLRSLVCPTMINVFFAMLPKKMRTMHLFTGCTMVNIICSSILSWPNLNQITPVMDPTLRECWIQMKATTKKHQRQVQLLGHVGYILTWSI